MAKQSEATKDLAKSTKVLVFGRFLGAFLQVDLLHGVVSIGTTDL